MEISLFWFRRDLRLFDNAGLYFALKSGLPVLPVFIFDTQILDKLSDSTDARVTFIYDQVSKLKDELQSMGSDLVIKHGNPSDIFQKLISEYNIRSVFTNNDYEPYAICRDNSVREILSLNTVEFRTYKDHVIFEKDEVVKDDGKPYTVFTPYKRKWMEKLLSYDNTLDSFYFLASYPTEKKYNNLFKTEIKQTMPVLESFGFKRSAMNFPSEIVPQSIIKDYDKKRDFPAINGTSGLGIHFRFGTVSIREKARKAITLNHTFLSELIWRDFYSMILFHFPYVEKGAFRKEYDNLQWRNNEYEFEAWCNGRTGYPIVDAGMRQLSATGYMHNRVRMIAASFLTKHLLIDWRWGEAWFAEKLLDFDLASNNGGWQWAAGCGTDAAPYFRIFSPDAQTEKFDKNKEYIKKWVPDYGTDLYPKPMVDHKMARERCLQTYKMALSGRQV